MRAMALRISMGSSKRASASVAPASKAKRASASGRFLRSRARSTPVSRPFGSARTTRAVRWAAAFSIPASASAGARSVLTTVTGPASAIRASPSTKDVPSMPATPSLIQTISASGVALRKRSIESRCAARSARCGCGLTARRRSAAAAGFCGRDLDRPIGGGQDRDDAALAAGRFGALEGDRRALAPVMRGRKAVVDDEKERRPAAAARHRVPDRAGGRQDQKRRERQPQQQQPPRRAGRRLPLRQQVHEDAQRREGDAPRLRRRHPQEQPDGRQSRQAPRGRAAPRR